MGTVRRFDRGTYRKPIKTPEGFLKLDGLITRTGVFSYQEGGGKVRRELRLESEVFDPESLASFATMPVTDEHPPEFVSSSNAQKYARGATGETVIREGDYVRAAIGIFDAGLVAKVEGGEAREISCGYTCELEDAVGEFDGEPYDCVQRKIRGNHVAIVPVGRAGPAASLRMDASDAAMVSPAKAPTSGAPAQPQERQMSVRKKRIDGVDFDVPEQAAQALENLERKHSDALGAEQKATSQEKARADAAEKERSTLQAKLDAAEEKAKELQKKLDAANDPKALRERIDARSKLELTARKVLGSKFKLDGLTDQEIQLAALKKARPSAKFDGKDAAYVAAAWDLLAEDVSGRSDADDDEGPARVRKVADRADADDDEENEDDDDEENEDRQDAGDLDDVQPGVLRLDDDAIFAREEKARARMKKANQDAWRKPLGSSAAGEK